MSNILISDAFAQASQLAENQGEFSFTSFIPLVAIFVIFYFLIIRPQSKKFKDHQKMVNELKVGNKIVTTGGIVGVVKKIVDKEEQIDVEIADNVIVKIMRQHIAQVVIEEKSKK